MGAKLSCRAPAGLAQWRPIDADNGESAQERGVTLSAEPLEAAPVRRVRAFSGHRVMPLEELVRTAIRTVPDHLDHWALLTASSSTMLARPVASAVDLTRRVTTPFRVKHRRRPRTRPVRSSPL